MISRILAEKLGLGGRLVPFFKAVVIYFLVGGGTDQTLSAVAVKCLPVLCLLVCVLIRVRNAPPNEKRYGHFVAAGLGLSALGDGCLVYETMLIHGMAAFACAHAAYVCAFGLEPLAWRSGFILMAAGMAFPVILDPPAWLIVPVRVYALLLACMAWRGIARPGFQRVGTLLFLLSDAILGYGMFSEDLPHQQAMVMSTYYLGQMSIALSAMELPKNVASHQSTSKHIIGSH